MNWRNLTTMVLIVGTATVILFDAIVAWRGGAGATISEVVLATALRRPIVPFALGVLVGHLFWSQVNPPA